MLAVGAACALKTHQMEYEVSALGQIKLDSNLNRSLDRADCEVKQLLVRNIIKMPR